MSSPDAKSSILFDYFVGGLALFSAIMSIAIFAHAYLPGVQMKILDELLDESKGIYESVQVGGLLPRGPFQEQVQKQLQL